MPWHYVVAKADIDTRWGVIPMGDVGVRVDTPRGRYIDFGSPYPLATFDEEVRDVSPLELLAMQAD